MFFASDNWAGAHPAINERLMKESTRFAAAYGTSELDKAIEQKFNEIFEREVAVFFVGTGTAANSLALASISRPGGITFCHSEAHVIEDECGAPIYFSNASRLMPAAGPHGKMLPSNLEAAINRFPPGSIHQGQPMAITMTQATEAGTIYTLDEIEQISRIAKRHNLPLHMDGARFANALTALDATPAEMTWKRGVDILSVGGTKNGCWCAEAIVYMDPKMAEDLPFIRKRSAQLFSKTRFMAAQFEAYFEGDLWLDLARQANNMATRLRAGFEASNIARLAWPTQSNELFVVINKEKADAARNQGAHFYDWVVPHDMQGFVAGDEKLIRLVTSFATNEADVDQFLEICAAS
jgi:threonine aldolase